VQSHDEPSAELEFNGRPALRCLDTALATDLALEKASFDDFIAEAFSATAV